MPPQDHRCWWTRGRRVELCLDGGRLSGSGVGIGFLLAELAWSHRRWYSVQLDADNAVFLTLPRASMPKVRLPAVPLLPAWLTSQVGLEEVSLSSDGFPHPEQANREGDDQPGQCECVIETHDDCYFSMALHDERTVEAVLAGVLLRLGQYVSDAHLVTLAPELGALLRQEGLIRLTAAADARRIDIHAVERGSLRWLRRGRRVGAFRRDAGGWELTTL